MAPQDPPDSPPEPSGEPADTPGVPPAPDAPPEPRSDPNAIVLAPYQGPVSSKAARAFAESARKPTRDPRRFAPFVATLAIVVCLLLLAAAALLLLRMRA